MTSNLYRSIRLATLVVSLGMATIASANHIDFMSDGSFFSATDAAGSPALTVQTGAGGNILGTEREVSILTSSGFVSAGTIGAAAGAGPVGPNPAAELQFTNSVTSAGQLMLTYDGVGSAGLGGLNFDTLWNFIAVDFSAVQGTGDLTIEVRDSAAITGSVTQSVASAGIYNFGFGDPGFAGVNFMAVDSVKVTLQTTTAASDFGIRSITREVVPEPATIGLLAIAGLTLLGLRRR